MFLFESLLRDLCSNISYHSYLHMHNLKYFLTQGITEMETFRANLTQADISGMEPIFAFAYKTSEAYNLNSFAPKEWADMTWKMTKDDELFESFLRYSFLSYFLILSYTS